MKMADILRSLADKLDSIEQGGEKTDRPANTEKSADDFQKDVDKGAESGNQDVEVTGVMVPPLQAKLEILKKSEGLPNVYDDQTDQTNELAMIKKNAGLTAAQQEAADDEPLDN